MKLAYLVDVHDSFEVVARALKRIGPVDLLLIGGDITNTGSPDSVEQAISLWRPLAPQFLALTGNMDSAAADARVANLGCSLDSRGVVLGDIGFFGVSGGPKSPLHTHYEITEEEIRQRIETGYAAVKQCRVKVFCPHSPPRGACDRITSGFNVGSTAIREFIDREQPDLVLCGHIHEARGQGKLGRTLVVNPGPAMQGHWAVVEIADSIRVTLDP